LRGPARWRGAIALQRAAGHGETEERWGQEYAMQKGAPFAMPRKTFLDPEGSLGER